METRENDYGIIVPKQSKTSAKDRATGCRDYFDKESSTEESLMNRLKQLGFQINLGVEVLGLKPELRAGFQAIENSTKSTSCTTTSWCREYRVFKVVLSDLSKLPITEQFKKDVQTLPSAYKLTHKRHRYAYTRFFRKYGHGVIQQAFWGGSISGKHSARSNVDKKENSISAQAGLNANTLGIFYKRHREILTSCVS